MLTEQRKRFVDELIKLHGTNQRQAAINAGYSPKSAESQASQILKDPKVKEYYNQQKSALIRSIWEKLSFMTLEAVETSYDIMKNPDAKDADRLKAAFDILDRSGFRPDDRDTAGDAEAELPKLLEALQEQEGKDT